jgi:hypothetical protein
MSDLLQSVLPRTCLIYSSLCSPERVWFTATCAPLDVFGLQKPVLPPDVSGIQEPVLPRTCLVYRSLCSHGHVWFTAAYAAPGRVCLQEPSPRCTCCCTVFKFLFHFVPKLVAFDCFDTCEVDGEDTQVLEIQMTKL